MYAALGFAIFVLLLGLASHFGWTVDSRDSSNWAASKDGIHS